MSHARSGDTRVYDGGSVGDAVTALTAVGSRSNSEAFSDDVASSSPQAASVRLNSNLAQR